MLTERYRSRTGIGAVKGGLFWKDGIERLLQQEGCVAMRYYYAQNEDGKPTLVLVGVDKEGHDMLSGVLLDLSWPCPPICDGPHPLNRGIEKRRLRSADEQSTAAQTGGNSSEPVRSIQE